MLRKHTCLYGEYTPHVQCIIGGKMRWVCIFGIGVMYFIRDLKIISKAPTISLKVYFTSSYSLAIFAKTEFGMIN